MDWGNIIWSGFAPERVDGKERNYNQGPFFLSWVPYCALKMFPECRQFVLLCLFFFCLKTKKSISTVYFQNLMKF